MVLLKSLSHVWHLAQLGFRALYSGWSLHLHVLSSCWFLVCLEHDILVWDVTLHPTSTHSKLISDSLILLVQFWHLVASIFGGVLLFGDLGLLCPLLALTVFFGELLLTGVGLEDFFLRGVLLFGVLGLS